MALNGKKINMRDIANALGVSVVTISKALTNKEGVGTDLRKKIKDKAEEMGYVYNPIPKLLLDGKTKNIGIIVSKKFLVRGYDVYFQIYEHIIAKLSEMGYYGILEVLTKQAEFDVEEPRILRDSKVDGVILLGQISTPYLEMIQTYTTPFVLLDFYGSYENHDAIVTDNFYGGYIVTSYLIKNGHKKIGFAGNYNVTSSIMDRYMGYFKALMENSNHEIFDKYLIMDRDAAGAHLELILPKELPTAFVCNNDEVAHKLIIKLNQMGIKVPDDISIVGFDNFEKVELSPVSVTTVEVDFLELAVIASDTIIKKVEHQSYISGRQTVGCKLVIRDSVKAI